MQTEQLDILNEFISKRVNTLNTTIMPEDMTPEFVKAMMTYLYEYDCEIVRIANMLVNNLKADSPRICRPGLIPTRTFIDSDICYNDCKFVPANYTIETIKLRENFLTTAVRSISDLVKPTLRTYRGFCWPTMGINPIVDPKEEAHKYMVKVLASQIDGEEFERDWQIRLFEKSIKNLTKAKTLVEQNS